MTKKTSILLFSGLAAAALISFIFLYIKFFINEGVFLPGVSIGGVEVQGNSPSQASQQVEEILNKKLQAPIEFYYQDDVYKTTLKEIALLDVDTIVQEAWQTEQNRNGIEKIYFSLGNKKINYPIKLSYKETVIKEWDRNWQEKWGSEARDAKIEINANKGLIIVPEQVGLKIDSEGTFAQLPQDIEDFQINRYAILSEETKPRITTNELKNMGEIASYTSWYNAGLIDRSHNLVQAAQKINGYVLPAGQIFSFNNTVGERIAATGFRDAMIIIDGKFEPGMGGGICQVSSTLYNAALLAGMEIVERHNHALAVAYVPLGRDATVAYGLQDFRFKNNSSQPVYLYLKAGQGKLTATLYGDLALKRNIGIINQVDKVIDYQVKEEIKADLQPGTQKVETKGQPGYQVRSYRIYYAPDKTEVKRELLAKDYYKPLQQIVHVGPAIDEETEPNEEIEENKGKPDTTQPEPENGDTLPKNPIKNDIVYPQEQDDETIEKPFRFPEEDLIPDARMVKP